LSWFGRRSRFKYATNSYEVNEALMKLDNELAELESKVEESATYYDLAELEKRIERIEKFLSKKFLEEWEAFES